MSVDIRSFFKSVLNAILGISVEIALAAFFIFMGFVTCVFWWGLFR